MHQPVLQCVLALQLARLVEITNSHYFTVQDIISFMFSPALTEGGDDALVGFLRDRGAIVLHSLAILIRVLFECKKSAGKQRESFDVEECGLPTF